MAGLLILDLPIAISRFPLPARLHPPDQLLGWEDVCFRVEDDRVQRKKIIRGEEKVEVFESFGLVIVQSSLVHQSS